MSSQPNLRILIFASILKAMMEIARPASAHTSRRRRGPEFSTSTRGETDIALDQNIADLPTNGPTAMRKTYISLRSCSHQSLRYIGIAVSVIYQVRDMKEISSENSLGLAVDCLTQWTWLCQHKSINNMWPSEVSVRATDDDKRPASGNQEL
jgi:hypothetical protein